MDKPFQRDNASDLPPRDARLMDELLRQVFTPQSELNEQRIKHLLDNLPPETQQPIGRRRNKIRSLYRWAPVGMAALLFIGTFFAWQVWGPKSNAYATVNRSLLASFESLPRKYQLTIESIPRPGRTRNSTSTLYVSGRDQFVMEFSSLFREGKTVVGRHKNEYWIVPVSGPILLGDEALLDRWMKRKNILEMPFLHVSTILERLTRLYELEELDDEVMAGNETDPPVVCQRIAARKKYRATWRIPDTVDLWANQQTGHARRIILRWNRRPRETGWKQVTIELVGKPTLDPQFFQARWHDQEGRGISSEVDF